MSIPGDLHDVVLTGLGVISARGDVTSRAPGGAFGMAPPPLTANLPIPDFALETYLASQKTYLDRCTALALAGCALALRDAGIQWPVADHGLDATRCGITLGTHLGCVETMKVFWDKAMERGVRVANPLLFSHSYFNTPISLCAIEFGLKGYHTTLCAGPASGLESVRAAYDAIRLGHADLVVAGGVEALTPTRSQCEGGDAPLGEGAAWFVLETPDAAARRNAPSVAPINDELLDGSRTHDSAIRAAFGDCGGATSALALAATLVQRLQEK